MCKSSTHAGVRVFLWPGKHASRDFPVHHVSLHEAFILSSLFCGKKQIRENILGSVYGEDQLSSDKYIVACTFLSRIQRDIYHCSWGKGGREGWGLGESAPLPQCAFLFFLFFLPLLLPAPCVENTLPPASLIHSRFTTCYFSFISVSPSTTAPQARAPHTLTPLHASTSLSPPLHSYFIPALILLFLLTTV